MNFFQSIFQKKHKPFVKVALAYKDNSSTPSVYHVGLGVTALNISKVLIKAGIVVEKWPCFDGYDLEKKINADPDITHVVQLAPWYDTPFLAGLTTRHPHIQFSITCHSNIGFLQGDGASVRQIKQQMLLQYERTNFHISGNSIEYCETLKQAFNHNCVYLPNLYDTTHSYPSKPPYDGGILRIGVFGATRPLKNMGTAFAGAAIIANKLQVDTEIWISSGRVEGGNGIVETCKSLVKNVPNIKVVENEWQTWPQFIETVRLMNLNMQPSHTESFNNVTADSIFGGVPVVTSPAIYWSPKSWQANPDRPTHVAEIGLRLLRENCAAEKGLYALHDYNEDALEKWQDYLYKK